MSLHVPKPSKTSKTKKRGTPLPQICFTLSESSLHGSLTFANVTTKIVLSKRLLLHVFTRFFGGGLVHAPYTD